MLQGSFKHLLSAPQVVTQITEGSCPDLFGVIAPAVLAVGMRPEVKDSRLRDVTATSEQAVEGLAAVRSAGEKMNSAGGAIDVLVPDDAALCSDVFDFPFDKVVDAVVIARQNRVTLSLLM